jgi:hypothetical protein
MKKILCVLVMGIAFNVLYAQTNYVEVSATDTVLLNADYFVFRVTATGDLDYSYNMDTVVLIYLFQHILSRPLQH